MRYLSLLRAAGQEIRVHTGRSLLSATSLIIGVLAVVAVQLAAALAQSLLIHSNELGSARQGAAIATLSLTPSQYRQAVGIVEDYPGQAVLRREDDAASTSGWQRAGRISVVGLVGNPWIGWPYDLIAGAPGPVLVNDLAAAALAESTPALTWPSGAVQPIPAASGVINDGQPSPTIYLALSPATVPSSPQTSVVLVFDAVNVDNAAMLSRLLQARGLPVDSVAMADPASQLVATLRIVNLGFTGVAAITLVVGVLGILNIGLATLSSRATELALRRCLGATKADIGFLVMADSLIIGLLGSLVALALAAAVYRPVVGLVTTLPAPPFPWAAALAGIVAGLAAGFLGGLAPSIKAGRLPLVTVMRA